MSLSKKWGSTFKFMALCGALLSFPQWAAATYYNTTIAAVMMDENNGVKLYVRPSGPISANGCQTNTNWPLVLDISTDFGKKLQAVILSAYATKATVVLIGKDSCAVHPGVDTLYRVETY